MKFGFSTFLRSVSQLPDTSWRSETRLDVTDGQFNRRPNPLVGKRRGKCSGLGVPKLTIRTGVCPWPRICYGDFDFVMVSGGNYPRRDWVRGMC